MNTRHYRLGRHALLAALRISRLRPADKVLVPGFICREILAAIYAVGAIPVFYEVGQDLKPQKLPYVKDIRVVLAVNYFGFPQELSVFNEYCKRHNALLIEDNAHGFLSCDLNGLPLGSRGDFGIFSMRKTFNLPDGAMLMVNKVELQKGLESEVAYSNHWLPILFWLKRSLLWLQESTGIAFLMGAKKFLRNIRYLYFGYAIKPSSKESEYDMPNKPAPHHYSIKVLSKLDCMQESCRRRNLYYKFGGLFEELNIKPVFNNLPVGTVPYGYAFYADDNVAKIATLIANKQNFDCIRWPDLPDAILPTAPIHYQTLWMVNFTC